MDGGKAGGLEGDKGSGLRDKKSEGLRGVEGAWGVRGIKSESGRGG